MTISLLPVIGEFTRRSQHICQRCGSEVSLCFLDGEGFSDIWRPDLCDKCEIERQFKRLSRLYRAWELSGLSDSEAANLTDPPGTRNSIAGWFNASGDHIEKTGHTLLSYSDVACDDELFGKAMATLIALGKQRRGVEARPSNIVPFQRNRKHQRV